MGKFTGHEAPPQIHPVSCIQVKERTAGFSQYPGYKSSVLLQTPQCLTELTHIGQDLRSDMVRHMVRQVSGIWIVKLF